MGNPVPMSKFNRQAGIDMRITPQTAPTERLVYADLMRILAVFLVIVTHVSGCGWQELAVGGGDWIVSLFYNAASRICVPLFVMLSGMFFLDPDKPVSIHAVYHKYLPRIIFCFLFWSALYALVFTWLDHRALNADFIRSALKTFLLGHYHLWFLYMIAGLYVLTPILRLISCKIQDTVYYILLWFIFCSLLPTFLKLFPSETITSVIAETGLSMLTGYSGYFLAGSLLRQVQMDKKFRLLLYVLGILGLAATISGTLWLSVKQARLNTALTSYFSPSIVLSSAAAAVFLKQLWQNISLDGSKSWIQPMSACVFGVYLIHDFWLSALLGNRGFFFLPQVLRIPAASLMIFCASLVCVWLLRRLPFFKRLL